MEHDLIGEVKNKVIESMQIKTEKLLNPRNYHLSPEAKKSKSSKITTNQL